MKSTGIVRGIDGLGRIVLPKELRSAYGITPDTPLEIFTEGDSILLRKYQPAGACALCGEVTALSMGPARAEGTLRERAGLIADSAGIPPASKLKKRKIISALKFACSALAGAAVTALISFLL